MAALAEHCKQVYMRSFAQTFRIQNSKFKIPIMAITYKVLKCKNPNGIDDVNYYSARAVKTGGYDFDDLADDLASMWGRGYFTSSLHVG